MVRDTNTDIIELSPPTNNASFLPRRNLVTTFLLDDSCGCGFPMGTVMFPSTITLTAVVYAYDAKY